jgi:XTP/dITP diphosphohydrolase
MELLLATCNKGKIVETRDVLSRLPVRLRTPFDLPRNIEKPEECGMSFKENAILKARYYFDRTRLPTLADDSGIIVEALHGELGIHTRRWGAGPDATDEEWVAFFLDRMRREENKRARFITVLAYIEPSGSLLTFEGASEGVITETLEAPFLPGLPLSGCFKPDGCTCVFSALSVEQKNNTIPRGRALRKFVEFLQSNPHSPPAGRQALPHGEREIIAHARNKI